MTECANFRAECRSVQVRTLLAFIAIVVTVALATVGFGMTVASSSARQQAQVERNTTDIAGIYQKLDQILDELRK